MNQIRRITIYLIHFKKYLAVKFFIQLITDSILYEMSVVFAVLLKQILTTTENFK